MKIDNFEAFNVTAMEIFMQSISHFPTPVCIDANNMASVIIQYFEEPADNSELKDVSTFLTDITYETLSWLHSEGFIRYCGKPDSLGHLIVLTNKGLTAINAVPSSIQEKKPFKELFKSGTAKIAVATATGLMLELFKTSS